jgi:hypothetical protein
MIQTSIPKFSSLDLSEHFPLHSLSIPLQGVKVKKEKEQVEQSVLTSPAL